MKNKMPIVRLCKSVQTGGYALDGFEAFNEWAMKNNVTWRDVMAVCARIGVDKETTMCVMACTMLDRIEAIREDLINFITDSPRKQGPTPARDTE